MFISYHLKCVLNSIFQINTTIRNELVRRITIRVVLNLAYYLVIVVRVPDLLILKQSGCFAFAPAPVERKDGAFDDFRFRNGIYRENDQVPD